jgi:hypothetical protein
VKNDGENVGENGENGEKPNGEKPNTPNGENGEKPNGEKPNTENGEKPNTENGEKPNTENGEKPNTENGENENTENGVKEKAEVIAVPPLVAEPLALSARTVYVCPVPDSCATTTDVDVVFPDLPSEDDQK